MLRQEQEQDVQQDDVVAISICSTCTNEAAAQFKFNLEMRLYSRPQFIARLTSNLIYCSLPQTLSWVVCQLYNYYGQRYRKIDNWMINEVCHSAKEVRFLFGHMGISGFVVIIVRELPRV